VSLAAKRIAGVLTIAALGLAIVIGVTKPNPFAESHTYWAVFDTAQGLGKIDRDVRVAGIKVGTMKEVERVGDDVRVELVLSEDFTIHSDARVDMRPHTLFEGSNFVDLRPGSPSAPVLEPGGEIPIEQTSNYTTLDEALRVLRPSIRTRLRDLAEVGSNTLRGQAIEGTQATLKAAPDLTKSLAPAARAAQGSNRVELTGAIQGVAETVDDVAQRENDLVPLLQGLSGTAAGLGTDSGAPLDAALVALPGALRELEATAPQLTRTVDALDRLAVEILPALPDLELAARELTPVLEKSIPVLERATPLVEDARLIASRLGKAREGLVQMFDLLPRTLGLFDEALEVITDISPLGASNATQLVAGGFTSLDASFRAYQTQTQNPIAPGHQLRIGTEFDFESIIEDLQNLPFRRSASGGGPPSCEAVGDVSKEAAQSMEYAGMCE
jgi:phospholipid/cholesterol/gamma-HCH transport system substrate-binding protein